MGNTSRRIKHDASRINHGPASAAKLRELLLNDQLDAAETSEFIDGLRGQIRSLHSHPQRTKPGSTGDSELNQLGTSLWNLCTRLRRTDAPPNSVNNRSLVLFGRVHAFHLLDAAQCTENAVAAEVVRLLRLALKAGRSCIGMTQTSLLSVLLYVSKLVWIDDSEFELATLVLQRAADYNTRLRDLLSGISHDDANDIKGLEAEYFILRAALASCFQSSP